MASSSPPPIEEHTPHSTPRFRRPRRTLSFSSSSPSHSCYSSASSSSFSFNDNETPPFSPITSHPAPLKGIPFSWEQVPGIPKHHCKIKDSSQHLLPLPPPRGGNPVKKKLQIQEDHISPKKLLHHSSNRFQMRGSGDHDPFLAAFLECSKDDDDDGNIWRGSSKVRRTLSDRFGFISMYTSCKRSCAVSESIVHLPIRPTPHYLLSRRYRH